MCRGCNYGRFLHIPEFWVYQVFAYASLVLNNPQVLNMLGLWIWQGYEYVRFTQGIEYTWLSLNMPYCLSVHEYASIMLNMIEYAGIYLKKQSAGYVRILSVSAVHSKRSLYKLLSNYQDRDKTESCSENTAKHLR